MSAHRYFFPAFCERVIDGDTAVLEFDLGFRIRKSDSSRLYGINAPELNAQDETTRLAAQRARDWLKAQIEGQPVYVESNRLDKYGRPLVTIWPSEDLAQTSVNDAMVQLGLAAIYVP